MATPVDIANMALSHLGETTIVALDDSTESARVMTLWFDHARRRALRANNWSCAIKRASLSAEVDAPVFGYANSFPVPADFIRLTSIENAGLEAGFQIESRKILTNLSAPLNIKYVYDLEDTSAYDDDLVACFALWLAYFASGKIAPSRTELLRQYTVDAKNQAATADGSSNSPQPLQGGSWLAAQAFTRDPTKWGGV